ncbi:mobilization protein MbpA [Salinimicrobium sp. TIG7-5_MAKvit]|uniref:mobilization protein MbpA n=1 Tax=Salinimicrobium sp. TIG7-5_MAKvit TaxID=3121289 RepID=UPI003C6E56C2
MREKNLDEKPPVVIDLSGLDPTVNNLPIDHIDTSLEEHSSIDSDSNSRCVPVGTKMIAPGGRNKKEMFKAKRQFVKFRCSVYEKKLLYIKAKRSRLSVSEFCRRAVFDLEIKERLSDDHIEGLKTLNKFHNNFKSIGNMFRKKDPRLSTAVYALAEEIKQQLQKFQK